MLEDKRINLKDLEKFKAAPIKVAVQKNGRLTRVSKLLLSEEFGVELHDLPDGENEAFAVSRDGQIGVVYVKTKALCTTVAEEAVDAAIVGSHQLVEDSFGIRIRQVQTYEHKYSWPLVIATPINTGHTTLTALRRIATQYPKTTRPLLDRLGASHINILPTHGSTEIFPYLGTKESPIDGIVDVVSTGRTLALHELRAWPEPIGKIYPVLIKPRKTIE